MKEVQKEGEKKVSQMKQQLIKEQTKSKQKEEEIDKLKRYVLDWIMLLSAVGRNSVLVPFKVTIRGARGCFRCYIATPLPLSQENVGTIIYRHLTSQSACSTPL